MCRGRFWQFDNFFKHLAECLAHALGGFGRRLDKETFVLSGDSCAFGFGDLSQVGLKAVDMSVTMIFEMFAREEATLSDLFPTIIFTARSGASWLRSENHHRTASKESRFVTSYTG